MIVPEKPFMSLPVMPMALSSRTPLITVRCPAVLKGLRCIHTHLKDDPLSRDGPHRSCIAATGLHGRRCRHIHGENPEKFTQDTSSPKKRGLPYEVMPPIFADALALDSYGND